MPAGPEPSIGRRRCRDHALSVAPRTRGFVPPREDLYYLPMGTMRFLPWRDDTRQRDRQDHSHANGTGPPNRSQ